MNRPNSEMSAEHKAALAEGRSQSATVRAYIEALDANRPKRGRKRTTGSVQKQLDAVVSELSASSGMHKLDLLQSRRNLERELARMDISVDMDALKAAFVAVAAEYGARRGIEYATWREFGVSAETLKDANINRTRG